MIDIWPLMLLHICCAGGSLLNVEWGLCEVMHPRIDSGQPEYEVLGSSILLRETETVMLILGSCRGS